MTKAQGNLTLYTDTAPICVLHNPFESLLEALDKAQRELNAGDRGGAYLTLYRELGNEQLLIQAQITTYSGIWGAGALIGNAWAKQEAGGRYNLTLDQFSKEIAQGTINAIRADMSRGGSGHLTDAQFQEADRVVWASKGMADLFPGNVQFLFGHNASGVSDAFMSRGTVNAAGAGVRQRVPTQGWFGNFFDTNKDGRNVADQVGKRPAEFANNPRYEITTASSRKFMLVIDKQTGFVEVLFSFNPPNINYVIPMKQIDNEVLDKDSLAYYQRQSFYKYLGANLHQR